jgi:pimeloyl-ACP methyl ester carboxylesterase
LTEQLRASSLTERSSIVAVPHAQNPARRQASGDASFRVRADDGVELQVEVGGPPDASVTVVFCHGFTGESGDWSRQRAAVGERARAVLWDQRGHGRSGWGPPGHATAEQTGRDLAAVLEAVDASGPVVLAGHSMGGASILALACQRPELVADRVAGVMLLTTSATGLVRDGVWGPLLREAQRWGLLRAWLLWLQCCQPALDLLPWRGSPLGHAFVRSVLFSAGAEQDLVRRAQEQLERLPLATVAAFVAAFLDHDQRAGLQALHRLPVVVLGGARDRLTPAEQGAAISAALGDCEFVLIPDAGHALPATHAHIVNEALHDLIDRAVTDAPPHDQGVAVAG